jgi:flagellin
MTVIKYSLSALTAQAGQRTAQNSLSMAIERLSAGLRFNSAKNDVAGLSISRRMTSDVRARHQRRQHRHGARSDRHGAGFVRQRRQ